MMSTVSKETTGGHQIRDEDKPDEICLSQSVIDACKVPLIGLQYVTEFQHKNSLATVCVCNLCEVKFSFKLIVSHVTAMKHRLKYMKERFMNYHTLIYQQAQTNADKGTLSVEYSQCIEDEEGRQKVKVKIVNSAATEPASNSGDKRPAESDDTPHPVSSKIRKVTDIKTEAPSLTNEPMIPRPARPQGPTSLLPLPAVPRPTRPYGLTFIGKPPLSATPREPLNNFRQPSPQPSALRSTLRTITPGTRTPLHSSPRQPLSNEIPHGPNTNRINFVGKTTSAQDTQKSDSDLLHLNQQNNILTPTSRSVENSQTEIQLRSPHCGVQWSSSTVPKKSCLKSFATGVASNSSVLLSTSGRTSDVSLGPRCSNQPPFSIGVNIKLEPLQDIKLEPVSSYPEPLDVKVLILPPPPASPPPLPASPPPLPPSPPPPLPPASESSTSQLEESSSSVSTLHLHPGFAKLMALIESPEKSSSPPARSSEILQNQSPPPPPPPSFFSGRLPQTQNIVHPGLKSTYPIQTAMPQSDQRLYQPFVGKDIDYRSSSAIKAFSGDMRPVTSHNIPQSNASLLRGAEKPISNHANPQSNANNAIHLTQSREDAINLPVIHQRPAPASQSSVPNASHSDRLSVLNGVGLKLLQHVQHVSSRPLPPRPIPSSGLRLSSRTLPTSQCQSRPVSGTTIPQSSDSVRHSLTENLNSGWARAPRYSSQSSTPWSSIRPQSESCPGQSDTNPKPINLIRCPPPSNHNPHPTQFPSVPGTRFISPPRGINSGMHPTNSIRPPSYRLPHGSTLQTPNSSTYGTGHQSKFMDDMSRSVCDGQSTNSTSNTAHSLLKHYSRAAGALLDEENLLPVGTDPLRTLIEFSKPTTRFPLEQPHPGSTAFAVSTPPGIRPFQSAHTGASMPRGLPHAHAATSNFRHMQRPRDPRSFVRLPISNVHPQLGSFRNTQPRASLQQELPKENSIPRAVNARQLPQSTIGRSYCEKNLQQTYTTRGEDFESTRSNPVSALMSIQHPSMEHVGPQSSLPNASAMSNALAKALVEYRMKQKSDKNNE